ncbi:SDR family NAD(P)-dependent oxidoreductase [Rheinheimera maricola]|uniref:SDR family NAD(P)-dependent oxidoreductase n=1 Tax=Rheinheimera maricola TaxID=2793282 RepID=A0ABS7XB70_9GAMM|nr:SDR family NAD(P)-dependent oxidoreductase [Rheinheimera maricola]MBZ9611968.1 SDR family NAD(P)-dependent oxidoreductase [Rheinheimera maricola]
MSASVLVIGGGSGIGLALAHHYYALGATVSVISRQPAAGQQWYWYQDELQQHAITEQLLQQALQQQPDTIFICNGVLHDAQAAPEKTIRQFDTEVLLSRVTSNVAVPARYLQLLFNYLCKTPNIKLLVLSAKVGSITDNALGGWYSYRISKAALNMLVKNLSIEVSRLNKSAAIVSVHPGTTDTALSMPFQANLPQGQLQSAASTALRLAHVAAGLQPAASGCLLNWDGSILPY